MSDSERVVEEYELPRQKAVVVVNPAEIGVDIWMLWVWIDMDANVDVVVAVDVDVVLVLALAVR